MEYEPAEYQKLQVRQYAPRELRETAEGKYWRQFKAPIVAKQVRKTKIIEEKQPPRRRAECLLGARKLAGIAVSHHCYNFNGFVVWRCHAHRLLPTVPL